MPSSTYIQTIHEEMKSSQVKSASRPKGEPNLRRKKTYRCTKNCTTYRRLSKNVVATFTTNRNPGNMEAEHPIGPHFSQQIPNCPKLCTCKTIPIYIVSQACRGRPRAGMLEMVGTHVLSAPSVRQVNLQCRKRNSSIESCTFLARTKFHWHGTSDPRSYPTHAKYHAIALTNSCRWRPHNATNEYSKLILILV